MIGNGELQEGMIWEALHIAPRYKLGNLAAILGWNGLQQFERQQEYVARSNRVTKEAVVTWPIVTPPVEQSDCHARAPVLLRPT
jgi:transketolase N-terminal domain/subunit